MAVRRYTRFGIWGIAVVMLFRLFILYYVYLSLRKLQYGSLSFSSVFTWIEYVIFSVLLVECIIYWYFRNHRLNINWVRLHVWLSMTALVILPVFSMFLIMYWSGRSSIDEFRLVIARLANIRIYLFIALISAATIFFITNIVKAIREPDEVVDEELGLLDEFTKEN